MPVYEGQKYGRLTAVSHLPGARWMCRCDCGTEKIIKTDSLSSGKTKSCGCLRRDMSRERATKHGGAFDPLYHVLNVMHQRCENSKNRDYRWYGAKGVSVCAEWALTNYAAFKTWAEASGYRPGLTIDRIDPNKNYEPGNCQWITIQEQQYRRRMVEQ